MRTTTLLVSLLAAAPFVACHDSDPPPPAAQVSAPVRGRVMDDRGQAVPGARVDLVDTGTPLSVASGENGRFVLTLPAGSHRIEVHFGDVLLCRACFTTASSGTTDLGDLYPGRASGCDQPTGCPGDADCDELSDEDEVAGWQVLLVDGDGEASLREVTSDPNRVDTDGDGLGDAEEFAARTDPRRRDTDGDGLPDFAELMAYKSNPWMLDSDGDARGPLGTAVSDPNLWDGFELTFSRTSPTLADTDGDGLTDWQEVHSGGTDPVRADLPRMTLDLHGDPTIVLDVTDVATQTTRQVTSTLEKEADNYRRTDTESTRMSIENTVNIHQELEVGTSNWPPSYEAKMTTDTEFKHGYATESLSSWTEESVSESQRNFETTVSGISNVRYDGGRVWAAVRIANASDLTFRIGDLRLVAQRMKPGGTFEPIGTLTLGTLSGTTWTTFEGAAGQFLLGPSVEYVGLVGADSLPAQVMRALVANPTALSLEIGSFTMHQLDAQGQPTLDYAVLGESIVQRTGLVVVDFGDGSVERHMVATNVWRFPDGSGRGVSMADAMAMADLGFTTEPHATEARRVLTGVRTKVAYVDAANPFRRGFWLVAGTGTAFDTDIAVDFEKLVLHSGERISLTWVEDRDGDGVFDREEYLLGTDPLDADSDEDGVNDYDEAKVGWEVAVDGLPVRHVHSDPRFPDLDRDYLLDGSERTTGTDPYAKDTDGDGFLDAFDPEPLQPPCLSATPLLLSGWWNGAAVGNRLSDVWTADGVTSHGDMFARGTPGTIVVPVGTGTALELNHDGDRVQIVDPPTAGAATGLSPVREYTIATRVQWAGAVPGAPTGSWSTLLTKGPRHRATYALSINDAGVLRASAFRRVYNKRWGWFFGWIDNLAEDNSYDERTEIAVPATAALTPNTWATVVATFGADAMRLYVNGAQLAAVSLDVTTTSGNIRERRTTAFLNGNPQALWLGADQVESGQPLDQRFLGYLDDVQYFHRALTADEVLQLHRLGSCPQTGN